MSYENPKIIRLTKPLAHKEVFGDAKVFAMADIVIDADGVVIKDRWGVRRKATKGELAMAKVVDG